jgi:membrane protein implicated in regulation of membrane protease activity
MRRLPVLLEQLLLGILVVGVVVLFLPFLLMAVGAAMLLWFVVSAAALGALAFWLVFPGTYGFAVLLLALLIGLLLVDRRSRHGGKSTPYKSNS